MRTYDRPGVLNVFGFILVVTTQFIGCAGGDASGNRSESEPSEEVNQVAEHDDVVAAAPSANDVSMSDLMPDPKPASTATVETARIPKENAKSAGNSTQLSGNQSAESQPAAGSPESVKIPQEVIDAPERKVVDRYDDNTPRKIFMAKAMPQGMIQHGPYVEYYRGGAKFKAGNFTYSKKSGEWTFWNEKGVVVRQGVYVADKLDGEWKTFRDSGSLKWIELYRDGQADGVWRAFGDDGKTPMWVRSYKNGEKHGAWVDYYANGQPRTEVNFVDGVQHGPMKAWFESGQISGEGNFTNGKRDGVFRELTVAGDVKNQATWVMGSPKLSSTSSQ